MTGLKYLGEVRERGHRRLSWRPSTRSGFVVAPQRSLRLVELYVARYVAVDPVPRQAMRNATVLLTGKLINSNHFLHQVDVYYEPLPAPVDDDWLRTPRHYSLPEIHVALRPKAPEGAVYTDGRPVTYSWNWNEVSRAAKLFKDAPGINTLSFGEKVPKEKLSVNSYMHRCDWAVQLRNHRHDLILVPSGRSCGWCASSAVDNGNCH